MPRQTLYYHAQLVTMDPQFPAGDALLVEGDRILALGRYEQMDPLCRPECRRVDLRGRAILPGFVDAHSHLTAMGQSLLMVDAAPPPRGCCGDLPSLLAHLKAALAEGRLLGGWLLATGYDDSSLAPEARPDRAALDRVSQTVPICLVYASGHCALCNSAGLQALGVGKNAVPPAGGGIPLGADGEPTGLLQEAAFFEKQRLLPAPSRRDRLRGLRLAQRLYASRGITTAQDAKTDRAALADLSLAGRLGLLTLDVACYLEPALCAERLPKQAPRYNPYRFHLRMAGVKTFLDGSPQAQTAWLSQPYYRPLPDQPDDWCGMAAHTDDEVYRLCSQCLKHNWQLNAHVNGDAALDQLLRCYRRALEEQPDALPLRPVAIHCQTARPDQLEEMAQLGMRASFFCDHVYHWGDLHYEQTLGPQRAQRISPVATAFQKGVRATLHQDSPVLEPNPLAAVQNAVLRRTRKGRVLGLQECLTTEEALRCMTLYAAEQLFEERDKGSLTPGKLADLVILDKNPLCVPPEQLDSIRVLETIKAGRILWQAAL